MAKYLHITKPLTCALSRILSTPICWPWQPQCVVSTNKATLNSKKLLYEAGETQKELCGVSKK